MRAGPALALGLLVAVQHDDSRYAAAHDLAVLSAAASGLADDLVESDPRIKGLAGHLGALKKGQLTTGAMKILGIGLGALGAAIALSGADRPAGHSRTGTGHRPVGVATAAARAGLIAGMANLVNLFDLRPGRALKLGLGAWSMLALARKGHSAAASTATHALAVNALALPADLAEKTMLGDCGANALGAAIGVNVASRLRLKGALIALGAVTGLILVSEKLSFSAVIERNHVLSRVDSWGRRP